MASEGRAFWSAIPDAISVLYGVKESCVYQQDEFVDPSRGVILYQIGLNREDKKA